MRSQSPYSEVPELISAFNPDYRKQSYHLHGRKIQNWQTLKSIFLDQHNEFGKFLTKVGKGALFGLANGVLLRQFFLRGPKKFQLDRLFLMHKGSPNFMPINGYVALGAFYGAVWWVVKDVICLTHGNDTFGRYILAHAIMGGIIIATLYNPANFIYGFAAGGIAGSFKDSIHQTSLPKNFQLKLKSVNEQQRRRLLREDQQFQLSQRHVLITTPNLYPL